MGKTTKYMWLWFPQMHSFFLKSVVNCSGENASKSASTTGKTQGSFQLFLCRCMISSLIAGTWVLRDGEVNGGQWNVVTLVRPGGTVHSHTLSLSSVISQFVRALARAQRWTWKGREVTNLTRHSAAHLPLQKQILKHCLYVLTPEVASLTFMGYSTGRKNPSKYEGIHWNISVLLTCLKA